MAKGKQVGLFLVYSTIYDVDLPKKVLEEMAEEKLEIDSEQSYDVEILFDAHAYETEEFYTFPVSKEGPVLRGRKKLSESEIKKEKMYNILGEQRENVVKALETAGIRVHDSAIIGEEYLVSCFVEIAIYLHEEEKREGGKKKTTAYIHSVMPSRKRFFENLEKAVKEINERMLRKKQWEEQAKEQHTPHWTPAEALFSEIARAMYPADSDMALSHKEMLYSTANVTCDWPLQIRPGVKRKEASINGEAKLDCPEYLIYTQQTTGEWSIDKTEDLRTAQASIVKHGYNLKKTSRMIVLHNLKVVPYTLYKETDEGLVIVSPEEARGAKKLHLSWNK